MVYDIDRIACRGLVPDLTLLIDVDVETGLARAQRRNQRTRDVETRIDGQSLAFHNKVREAYRHLAGEEPERIKVIDGMRPEAAVAANVWAAVEPLLAK